MLKNGKLALLPQHTVAYTRVGGSETPQYQHNT